MLPGGPERNSEAAPSPEELRAFVENKTQKIVHMMESPNIRPDTVVPFQEIFRSLDPKEHSTFLASLTWETLTPELRRDIIEVVAVVVGRDIESAAIAFENRHQENLPTERESILLKTTFPAVSVQLKYDKRNKRIEYGFYRNIVRQEKPSEPDIDPSLN